MKTRTRKSEYQRAFQGPDKEYCKNHHEELYTFRIQQRQHELTHQRIKWDSSESSSSGNSSECVSPHSEDQETQAAVGRHDGVPMTVNQKSLIPEEVVENIQILKDGEVENHEEMKPKSFGRKSTEPKREETALSTAEKPPFVTYGNADRELETAHKFTHNVRANSRYVYPSALKKQKLIKNRKSKQEKTRADSRASVAAALQCKQKAILNDVWMTEYQRCYSRASTRPSSANDGGRQQDKGRSGRSKRPKTR